jgi:hypothetical protein
VLHQKRSSLLFLRYGTFAMKRLVDVMREVRAADTENEMNSWMDRTKRYMELERMSLQYTNSTRLTRIKRLCVITFEEMDGFFY